MQDRRSPGAELDQDKQDCWTPLSAFHLINRTSIRMSPERMGHAKSVMAPR